MRNFISRAQLAVHAYNLAVHLSRIKIPYQSVQSGSAKGAAHMAAHLRRNAKGIAVIIFHQHPFYNIAVLQEKEIFAGAVQARNKPAVNLRASARKTRQLAAQRQGEIAHFLPFRAFGQPGKKLSGPESGLP